MKVNLQFLNIFFYLECPEHEVYATCGSACPPTCLDQHRFCLDRCVKGCTCKPGYIRKYERGPCVRMDSCPKSTKIFSNFFLVNPLFFLFQLNKSAVKTKSTKNQERIVKHAIIIITSIAPLNTNLVVIAKQVT